MNASKIVSKLRNSLKPRFKLDYLIKKILKFIYFIFILAGITSAIVSALIEFEVFADLFRKSSLNRFNMLIPGLIVFTFETSKVYLIYMNKSFKITANEHYLTDRKHFLTLRYALISISVLSTFIFSYYNLHNPNLNQNLKEKNSAIETIFLQQKNELNNIYDEKEKKLLSPIDEALKDYEKRMTTEENYKFSGRQEYRGPRYNEAKKLRDDALAKRQAIASSISEERINELNKLRERIELTKEQNAEKFESIHISGNQMLNATLQVVNLKSKYPEWHYLLIITFISAMLSIGLEYIIWAAFTTLAIDHTKKIEENLPSEAV